MPVGGRSRPATVIRVDHEHVAPSERKDVMRRHLLDARRSRSDAERTIAARANDEHLARLLSGAAMVCAYLPLASEPMTTGLLDELVAGGTMVLVPLVSPDAALDWCLYPGPTTAGPFGIAEPTGPRLGPSTVCSADAVVVPALAVDQFGRRLGRGGGHYDRTLALLPQAGPADRRAVIAVLFDGELIERVPAEEHDKTVTAVASPTDGIVHFRS